MPAATIALTTTPQTIASLINAISGHANDQGACTSLAVRGHDANTGIVYLAGNDGGTNAPTTSNYAIELNPGDSRTYPGTAGLNNVSLLEKTLYGSDGSEKADVEWNYA